MRHNSQVATRLLKEENEMLRSQLQGKMEDLEEMQRRQRIEGDAIRSSAAQEGEMYAEQFRRQAQAREEDLSVLKQQYSQVQSMYEERVSKLESSLGKLRKRHRSLLDRRALDFEGFGNDVTALRRQLERLELLFARVVQRMEAQSSRGGGSSRGASEVLAGATTKTYRALALGGQALGNQSSQSRGRRRRTGGGGGGGGRKGGAAGRFLGGGASRSKGGKRSSRRAAAEASIGTAGECEGVLRGGGGRRRRSFETHSSHSPSY